MRNMGFRVFRNMGFRVQGSSMFRVLGLGQCPEGVVTSFSAEVVFERVLRYRE